MPYKYNVCKYFFVGLAHYLFQELNFCSLDQCLHVAGMDTLLCFTMAKLLIIYREACTCVYILCEGMLFCSENCCREINDIGCCKFKAVSLLEYMEVYFAHLSFMPAITSLVASVINFS